MSIAPPSDIIFDVAQAADPARRQAAVSKLADAAAQGGSPPVSFDAALTSATPGAGVTLDRSLLQTPLSGAGRSQVSASHLSTYQKFEATVLQSFVQTILPKDTELFGDAASADMCRSLLAEKVAEQLAKSGKIGIARAIESHEATLAHATAVPPPKTPQG